jgi:PAS domain S-box-containing protein
MTSTEQQLLGEIQQLRHELEAQRARAEGAESTIRSMHEHDSQVRDAMLTAVGRAGQGRWIVAAAVVEWGRDLRVSRWSSEAERIFGWKADEVLGKHPDEWRFVHEGDVSRATDTMHRLLAGQEPRNVCVNRNHRRDGSVIECEWHNWAMQDERGAVVSGMSLAIDLTAQRATEDELWRTTSLLHALLATSPDPVFARDIEGRMLLASPATLRAIGKPAEQVLGHTAAEWLEDRAQAAIIMANDRSILETGQIRVVEETMTTPAGPRVFLGTKMPLRDQRGRVVGLIGTSRDITDRKRIEDALRQSEQRLRLALDAGRMGTWTMDLRTGDATWDASMRRIFGVGPELSVRFPDILQQVVHPDDRAYVEGTVERALAPGSDGRYLAEYRILRRDGAVRRVLVTGQAAFVGDGPGRAPVRMVGTIADVTEHREIERALRESEARFQQLVESLPQLVWACRPEGYCDYLSPQWQAYTGQSESVHYGLGWGDALHPDDRERTLACWNDAMEGRGVYDLEYRLRRADGVYRWFHARAVALRDMDGRIVRWFGTSTDVHDRKLAEEALQEADQRKDEFMAMLAHELRNPLAPVRTAVEVINLSGDDADKARQMRDMIERQVTHMARLLDDLLDVSRIARGKVQLRMERCDLVAIVRNVTEDYRPIFTAGGLTLGAALPAGPLWAQGDVTRLAQVIGNLLGNASKFSQPGGHVGVSLEADARGAVIAVRDNGLGIEPAMLARVFEPFVQADLGMDRNQGGLGLGLALVRGVVELHGGTVEARSDGIGHGATFLLRLPLASPKASASASAGPTPANGETQPGARLRILIIEDNRDTADSLQELLTLLGHEAEAAYAGPAALELAPRFRPDVVLCDIGLPGLDGFEVARALRQHPATQRAYLVAQTGYGQDEDRRRTRAAGFDQHLRKPVELDELQRLLATVARR